MKTRLLFLIHALNPAGAQKVLVRMVNALDPEKYEITIKTIYNRHDLKSELVPSIRLNSIIKTKRPALVKLYGYLIRRVIPSTWTARRLIGESFDYQIAFLEGEATKLIAGSRLPKERKFAWVHCNFMELFSSQSLYKTLDKHRKIYEQYGRVICVSKDSKDAFIKRFGNIGNTSVLYNPIDDRSLEKLAAQIPNDIDVVQKRECLNIIQVGNCRSEKAYDRMFSVCKRLKDNGYKFSLLICGSGSEFEKLQHLKTSLGLDDCVKMLGNKNNPYPYVKNADLLVCSSYSEAFSTVVIESVLLKCPVLTTDCSGMSEILDKGKYGIIVENSEEGLYQGLKNIMEHPEILQRYKAILPERRDFFSKEECINKIENLFS